MIPKACHYLIYSFQIFKHWIQGQSHYLRELILDWKILIISWEFFAPYLNRTLRQVNQKGLFNPSLNWQLNLNWYTTVSKCLKLITSCNCCSDFDKKNSKSTAHQHVHLLLHPIFNVRLIQIIQLNCEFHFISFSTLEFMSNSLQ